MGVGEMRFDSIPPSVSISVLDVEGGERGEQQRKRMRAKGQNSN